MATFELVLLLGVSILVSAVVDQLVPRVSLPLIQVVIGLIIALVATTPINATLDPEFFLVLFVAPLLFHDAKHADKHALWRNKGVILSLAIGLVVAIMLSVGFFVHWIVPSIPLFAAFALGAALGPTDAVAVTSLSRSAALNRRENALLEGEALLNDASGVVGFQFTVAAVVTGAFSLFDATTHFILAFFGGIVLGVAVAFVLHLIQVKLRDLGLESTTFYVLFEVLTPFLLYLLAETINVSGILAVVAAGIVMGSFSERHIGPSASRLNIVTENVWRVLLFFINGVVFTLLGMQLPKATHTTWDSMTINNGALIGYIFAITAIIVVVRFVWLLIMNRASKEMRRQQAASEREKTSSEVGTWDRSRYTNRSLITWRQRLHTALVTTIGGPKGSVTLCIIFSIPLVTDLGTSFPQRSLIIFLASGVILITLLLANFLLPVLAPHTHVDSQTEFKKCAAQRIEILQTVISKLSADQTDVNGRATQQVIRSYHDRIGRIRNESDLESPSDIPMRLEVIRHEQEYISELIDREEIDPVVGYQEIQRLMREAKILDKHTRSFKFFSLALHHLKRTAYVAARLARNPFVDDGSDKKIQQDTHALRIKTEKEAIAYLEDRLDNPDYPASVIGTLLISHENTLRTLERSRTSITALLRANDDITEIERNGLRYELEAIQDMYDAGRIPRSVAKTLRDNVYLMQMDNEDHI